MDHLQYVYQMKGLIELSNYVVTNFSSKCTTPYETEGESKELVKMYGKCITIFFN